MKKHNQALNGIVVGLVLAGFHTSTHLLSTGQEQKAQRKSSWAEINTGRSLTDYCWRQNRPYLWKTKLIYCQLKIEWDGEETEAELKPPSPSPPSSQAQFHS